MEKTIRMNKIATILLVEDDQLDVMDIRRSLNKLGIIYKIIVAKNGEEAIDFLRCNSDSLPDIILIDVNMPRMNGLELLGVIRNNVSWKDLKCFIITTSDEKADREAARSLGISGYIVKPFKINNVSSMDSFNLMIDLMNMKE
jgi:CheY-like chemotaxis protein